MEPVFDNLYQFTQRSGQMSLPVHQYLLAGRKSLMIATGSYDQAKWILPFIDQILQKKPLDYLFISHMESDECGGISLFLKKYPHVTVICSPFASHELRGYGFKPQTLIGEEGKTLLLDDLALKFFKYPSEVHLQDGLLLAELNRGIFYSSDLMLHHMTNDTEVAVGKWNEEVDSIDSSNIPTEFRREHLKTDLARINPKFIATGHGSCVIVRD